LIYNFKQLIYNKITPFKTDYPCRMTRNKNELKVINHGEINFKFLLNRILSLLHEDFDHRDKLETATVTSG